MFLQVSFPGVFNMRAKLMIKYQHGRTTYFPNFRLFSTSKTQGFSKKRFGAQDKSNVKKDVQNIESQSRMFKIFSLLNFYILAFFKPVNAEWTSRISWVQLSLACCLSGSEEASRVLMCSHSLYTSLTKVEVCFWEISWNWERGVDFQEMNSKPQFVVGDLLQPWNFGKALSHFFEEKEYLRKLSEGYWHQIFRKTKLILSVQINFLIVKMQPFICVNMLFVSSERLIPWKFKINCKINCCVDKNFCARHLNTFTKVYENV